MLLQAHPQAHTHTQEMLQCKWHCSSGSVRFHSNKPLSLLWTTIKVEQRRWRRMRELSAFFQLYSCMSGSRASSQTVIFGGFVFKYVVLFFLWPSQRVFWALAFFWFICISPNPLCKHANSLMTDLKWTDRSAWPTTEGLTLAAGRTDVGMVHPINPTLTADFLHAMQTCKHVAVLPFYGC